MLKLLRIPAVLVALGVSGPLAIQAQVPAPRGAAGDDLVTVSLYGGGFSPTSSLTSGADFERSGTVGGNATLWLHRYAGVRANVLYARTSVSSGAAAPLAGERPDIWAYSGDVVLRLPRSTGNGRSSWFPYVVGGLGGKTYRFDSLDTATDFAGNFGGGLEYRFARWGIQAEVRDVVSKFDRHGVDRTQHDVLWTVGLTLSL